MFGNEYDIIRSYLIYLDYREEMDSELGGLIG